MSTHTPGPWKVGRELGVSQLMPAIEILREVTFVEGASPTTYHLAEVSYPTSMGGTAGAAERHANARLIAAAPDLLAALTEAEDYLRNCANSPEIADRCRAAIAAATGQQQSEEA